MKGKNQMKIRRLMTFFMAWFVMLNFCPQMTFADEIYDKCVIPIISDKSEKLTWDGLKKDGTFYVTLEDACILTGAEVVKQSNDNFVAERNTVKLFGDINDNEACLCVAELDALLFSWDGEALKYPQAGLTNRILYKQPFHLDMTCFEGKVWVDLFSYANCFGADINILTEDSESYKYLGEINLTEFDGCYTIETGTPFDEIYTEFMNHSELQFEWIDWGQEVGVFVAKGYNAVINEYKNVFNYAFEDYDSTKTYRDVLLNIIECRTGHFSDNSFIEDMEKYQEDSEKEMNAIFFTLDSILDDDNPFQKQIKKELGDAKSIVSGTKEFTDVIYQYSKLAYNINKMNEVEIMLLEKSILDDNARDEEAYNSKNAAANVDDFADIIKKVLPSVGESMESSAAKFQKIIEDYASLYDSAEKLNNEIQSYEKLTEDALTEIANNLWVMLCDYALGETMDNVAPKTKSILDVFDFAVGQMKSDTMASVSDSAQAHFIQKTVLKNVKLDKSDTSYYSLLMAMQSSYMANKNIMTIDANVSPEQATLAVSDDLKRENILFQLEDLITKAYTCNRNFYNSPETNRKNIPDYSISTELYKKEPAVPINWHLEPTIEADNIIVPDYDNELYEKYAIIEKDGKYGVISNKGKIEVDCKYMGYEICSIHNIFIMANPIKDNNISKADYYKFENNKLVKTMSGGHGLDRIYYVYDKSLKKSFSIGLGYMEEYIDEKAFPAQEVFKKNERGYYDEYGKWGIISGDSVIKNFEYDNGRYSDNLVALEKNELWGYFDQNGKELIPFIAKRSDYINHEQFISSTYNYDNMAFMDVDGILAVNTKDGGCFYDIKGNQLTNSKEFEEVRPMINGFAWVKKDGKWGVIKFDSFDSDENSEDSSIEYIEQTENLIKFTYKENSIESLSSDGTLVYTTSAKYPIFEGENVKILNDEIQKSIVLEGLYQEDCDELLEDWKELQFPLPTYDKYEFTVTYNHNGYISIIEYGANNEGYMSSIYYFYTSFIYDINAKKLVKYSDFFDMNEKELQQLVFSYSDLSSSQRKFYSVETATLTQNGMKFYLSDGPHAKRHEVTIPFSDSNFKIKLLEKTNNSTSENTSAKNNKGTVKIEDGYLNVRETPSTKGKIIGKLYNGDEINIEETSEDGKWLKISKGDIKGYVSSDYISKNGKKEKITMEDFIKGVNCFISINWNSNIDYKVSQNFSYEEKDYFYGEIRTENNNFPIVGWCEVNKNTGSGKISYLDGTESTFNINDYL